MGGGVHGAARGLDADSVALPVPIIVAMKTLIEPAREADAEAIADVVNRAYRPEPRSAGWTHESALVSGLRTSPTRVLELFRPDSVVLVMRQAERIVACVHVECVGVVCWIGMLATLPDLQAAGIGKRMLAAAEDWACRTHAPQALQMSVLSNRPELLSFYQRRGYALTGAVDGYPTEAGVGAPLRNDLQVLELRKNVGLPA